MAGENLTVGWDAPKAPTPTLPLLPPGQTPVSSSTSTSTSTGSSAGTITKNLPDWIPHSADSFTGELQDTYKNVDNAFNTSAVDAASAAQQAQDLTSGLRAANSAATEYTTRTMQQGGSGAASGLIRAEGQVKAMDTAGAAKVEAAKYDVQQREAAAGQAAQIASTLAGLRSNYLSSLAGITTGQTSTGNQSGSQSSLGETGKTGTGTGTGGGVSGPGGFLTDLGGGFQSTNGQSEGTGTSGSGFFGGGG